MRRIALLALAGLAGCATAPAAPPAAVGSGSPPVLDGITQKTIYEGGFPIVLPEFHFHDADGDAVFLARELVSTNGPVQQTRGAPITFPADFQKRGAILAGRWPCGPNVYQATLRAYVMDRTGNRSNAMSYVIHCNGG